MRKGGKGLEKEGKARKGYRKERNGKGNKKRKSFSSYGNGKEWERK